MNPEKDLAASNLPGQRGDGGEEIRVQRGMFGADNGGDTSGYGGLVRSIRLPGAAGRPYGGWFDEVADELEGALEEQGLVPENVIEKTVVDRGEITFHIEREYLRARRPDPPRRPGPPLRTVHRRQRRPLPAATRAASCTPSTTCARSPTTG